MPPDDENTKPNINSMVPPLPDISPVFFSSKSAKSKHLTSPALPPRPPPPRPLKRKSGVDYPYQHPTENPQSQSESGVAGDKIALDSGVQVIVRIRPLTREEEQQGTQIAQEISSDTVAVADQQFTFDAVAGTESTQQEIFEMVGVPLVENCLAGFNSSIFAYGQTGSGKTYTMWGPSNASIEEKIPSRHRGITPRVFEQLFARIQEEEHKNAEKQLHYQCRCSFLEIYNEQITDLLEPTQRNLQIREDTKSGVYVENITEEYVASMDDVTQLFLRGLANRRVGATSINAESSRSHSVFTCVLESRCKSVTDGLLSLRTSRINLVDLAGSERQKLTGAAGERLKEAGNINRSLSQLGNLINILAEVSQRKQRHIPYRDSKLTFLLQESLGGNAKLAMICAISPASSCRNETLSTLRFAKRAKGIQNKAVVNEENDDDVNILREQIRQLKDELVKMKSNDNGQVTGWNPRRSLNILRLSLNRPLTLPQTDTESDEDMEIDEESGEKLSSSCSKKRTIQTELDELRREISDSPRIQLGNEEKHGHNQTKPSLYYQSDNISKNEECKLNEMEADGGSCPEATKVPLFTSKTTNSESGHVHDGFSEVEIVTDAAIPESHPESQTDEQVFRDNTEVRLLLDPHTMDTDCDDCTAATKDQSLYPNKDFPKSTFDTQVLINNVEKSTNVQSPTFNIKPCQSSPTMECPTLSVSPEIKVNRSLNKLMQKSAVCSPVQEGNSKKGPELLSVSFGQSLRNSSHIQSSNCSDKSLTSPTDSLAASLHRGLQIIDHHQQNSSLRKSSVRFSFKTLDPKALQAVDKVDVGIQTSPEKNSAVNSPDAGFCCACNKLDITQQHSTEYKKDTQDKSDWQLIPIEEPKTPDGAKHHLNRAVEKVLAGAIRREMALDETCNKQAAEIEQLNRLIRQYRHERECNSIIQQSREDKIVRLEALMDGVIPTEDFMEEEFASLMNEHKLLKDKYENHPEVTRANIEQKCLMEELEKYRNFYELGERDALLEEIQHLRFQLQSYLESSSPRSIRKRLSLTPKSMSRSERESVHHPLALCAIPEIPFGVSTHAPAEVPIDASIRTSKELDCSSHNEKWEEERQQWTERESEWISLAEELRLELNSFRRLAEKRKQELECEQRCSEELKEAFQMAMDGHARLLDQYADLQEKHTALHAKHRKIKEGVTDIKRAAAKAGVKGAESRFIEAQAAQLVAMKLDRDREHKMMREEIKGLQAQLRDTAEAVQAAGELLVRLKEAEEAISIAQESAAIAERNAEIMHRDMEKMTRKHATEMATMNQRLLEARLVKSRVCPMCQVAGRVKYEFPDADEAILEAEAAAKEEQTMSKPESRGHFEPFPHEYEDVDYLRMGEPSWFTGHDSCNI